MIGASLCSITALAWRIRRARGQDPVTLYRALSGCGISVRREGLGVVFCFPRTPDGQVLFPQTWWRAIVTHAARIKNIPTTIVKKIEWSPAVDGSPRLWQRYIHEPDRTENARPRYAQHEAFLPGRVIGVECILPVDLTVDTFVGADGSGRQVSWHFAIQASETTAGSLSCRFSRQGGLFRRVMCYKAASPPEGHPTGSLDLIPRTGLLTCQFEVYRAQTALASPFAQLTAAGGGQ